MSAQSLYEMDGFGIKIILIEPGVIKTNFDNNLKIGIKVSTTNDRNSPYADIIGKRLAGFKPRFENGLHAIVAKVILKTIIPKNPLLKSRYMVGDDDFDLMEIRKNKSDKEFRRLVMEGVLQ